MEATKHRDESASIEVRAWAHVGGAISIIEASSVEESKSTCANTLASKRQNTQHRQHATLQLPGFLPFQKVKWLVAVAIVPCDCYPSKTIAGYSKRAIPEKQLLAITNEPANSHPARYEHYEQASNNLAS
jgi:hypothetical protein